MTVPLARPVTVTLRGMARVLSHLVALRRVRRVRAWERRARLGDGGIYRDVGVRLDAWSVMMVMVMAILQRHGRTCSLRHTCCRVAVLSVVLLTRQVFLRKVGGTRRRRIGGVLGARSGGWVIIRRANLLLWGVLRSRRWICGRGLGSVRRPMWFTDECANLTASIGRVQLCPSIRVGEEKEVRDCILNTSALHPSSRCCRHEYSRNVTARLFLRRKGFPSRDVQLTRRPRDD